MFGFQAAGSAPIVRGHVVKDPETIASAIRIGNPASWELATRGARRHRRLLRRHRRRAHPRGASHPLRRGRHLRRAGLGDQRRRSARAGEAGAIPKGATVVLTVTGHGLKDPQWALRNADGTDVQAHRRVPNDTAEIAERCSACRKRPCMTAAAARGCGSRALGAACQGAGDDRQPRARFRHARPRAVALRRARR